MKKIVLLIMCISTLVLGLAACGNDSADSSPSGKVATDGSTSMEKLIGLLGETFTNENPDIDFTYNATGSSAGITAVSEGRCDFGLSSRSLTAEEKSSGLTETVIAYDGIAIVANPKNGVKDLSTEDLKNIYTGQIKNWNELGGKDMEIVVIGREAGSGTRDGFESIIDIKGQCNYRQELTSTGDVLTAVSKNENAIGYVSLASVNEDVKVLTIGGIAPNEKTILGGTYAIQRPFLIVTNENKELSKAAKAFLEFITSSDAKALIEKAGVFPGK